MLGRYTSQEGGEVEISTSVRMLGLYYIFITNEKRENELSLFETRKVFSIWLSHNKIVKIILHFLPVRLLLK